MKRRASEVTVREGSATLHRLRADLARRTARTCARAAAAASMIAIGAVANGGTLALPLALGLAGVLLARRVTWVRLESVEQRSASVAEMRDSFARSNWRERTAWRWGAAAVIALSVVIGAADPAAATAGPHDRRSLAALADTERAVAEVWGPRATALRDRAAAQSALIKEAPAMEGETARSDAARMAWSDVVDERRDTLVQVEAALDQATALREHARDLAAAGDARAFTVTSEADEAARAALAQAETVAISPAPGFTLRPPADGEVSSPFGLRDDEFHEGIDIAANLGTTVVAAAAGTVTLAGRPYLASGDDAVVVIIDHGNGFETLYGHLAAKLEVRVGQQVEVGTLLGRIGLTGRTTGPHLHFMTYFEGRPVDPARFLS